jgi:P-type conjugative transfer protein TrbL
MADKADTISPMVFNLIQSDFLKHIGHVFETAVADAKMVFISIAIIELVIFGIVWGMRAENVFGEFIFKVIKLTLVFSVISYLPDIAAGMLDSVSAIANSVSNSTHATKLILNPGYIWKYGFDASISLVKLAVSSGSSNGAAGTLYNLLGFGSLLLFALIGAQIIAIMCGFYLVSLAALFLIPFGALTVFKNLFTQAITHMIRLSVQVMTLVIIMSVAISIWSKFDLKAFDASTKMDQPLGLFFCTLVICILVYQLPRLVARTVGDLGGNIFESLAAPSPSVNVTAMAPSVSVAGGGGASPSAAAASAASVPGGPSTTTSTSGSSGAASSVSVSAPSSGGGSIFGGGNTKGAKAAVNLSKGSMEQLKTTLAQSAKK